MNHTRRHVIKSIAAIPVAPLLARGEPAMTLAVTPVVTAPAASCCACGVPTGFTVTVSGMGPLDGCYDRSPWFMSTDGRGGYTLDTSLMRQVVQPFPSPLR